jgi:hypothetical protein
MRCADRGCKEFKGGARLRGSAVIEPAFVDARHSSKCFYLTVNRIEITALFGETRGIGTVTVLALSFAGERGGIGAP